MSKETYFGTSVIHKHYLHRLESQTQRLHLELTMNFSLENIITFEYKFSSPNPSWCILSLKEIVKNRQLSEMRMNGFMDSRLLETITTDLQGPHSGFSLTLIPHISASVEFRTVHLGAPSLFSTYWPEKPLNLVILGMTVAAFFFNVGCLFRKVGIQLWITLPNVGEGGVWGFIC